MRKRTQPTSQEAPFHVEELFFSTTDHRGVITYGNDVFIKISGFPTEEIIGAPHNIIRHPDMPRSIFKLFWDTLKGNRPIAAYVKNMASNGAYYWVFAFAFPIQEGYLSIRFKPTSPLFKKVQEIYSTLLNKESQSGMEEAGLLLQEILLQEGFADYDAFMLHAIVEELKSWDAHLQKSDGQSDIETNANTRRISESTRYITTELEKTFSQIDHFRKSYDQISSSMNLLHEDFNKLKFISINMKVLAEKFGNRAVTLGIVSNEFSSLSEQIANNLSTFNSFIKELSVAIDRCSLNLGALKIQVNMVDFFVKESLLKLQHSADAFDGMIKNRDCFVGLFSQSVNNLKGEINSLKSRIARLTMEMSGIQQFMIGLEVIKQTGAIEASRDDEVKASFGHYLQDMDSFIALLRKVIQQLEEQRGILNKSSDEILRSVNSDATNVEGLFDLAMNMKAA